MRDDASIERKLLGLACHLRLQIADRPRHLGLLASAANTHRIELRELSAKADTRLVLILTPYPAPGRKS